MAENNRTVFAEERKRIIVELIEKNKKVTVPELSELLEVSGSTIRTYLRELENDGLLKRTHGGAVTVSKARHEFFPEDRTIKRNSEKIAIAREAVNLIDEGDTIILDTGSTTYQLALLLERKKNITVLTNDTLISAILENHNSINVILIGGQMKKKFHCTVGSLGLDMVTNMVVDKAFMGANGISPQKGASTPDIALAEMKSQMIAISDKVIFLCDSSKMNTNLFMNFARPEDIDLLITDSKINNSLKEEYLEQGLELILA